MASFPCSASHSQPVNLFPSVKTTITKKKYRRTDQQAEPCTNAHSTSEVPKTWLAKHQWSARYIQVDCEQGYIPH